jgi:predicted Zn-dependent protease
VVSFIAAVLVAIILNVDTLHLARVLWNDPALRQTVVYAAENATQSQIDAAASGTPTTQEDLDKLRDNLQTFLDLRLPIGWEANTSADALALASPRNVSNFSPVFNSNWVGFLTLKLIGWILTAFAIMQGSDFWFNLLGRLTQVRTAAAKITESVSGANPSGGAS